MDAARCPVCLQVVRDAYLTTCGHNFCCTCIFTHLGSAQSCPVCLEPLSPRKVVPNALLNTLLQEAETRRACDDGVLPRQPFCHATATVAELDTHIEQLLQRKRALEQDTEEASLEVLLEFLSQSKLRKTHALNEVKQDLSFIDADIHTVHHWSAELAHVRAAQRAADVSGDTPQAGCAPPGGASAAHAHPAAADASAARPAADAAGADDADAVSDAKKRRVMSEFENLQRCYLLAHSEHAAAGGAAAAEGAPAAGGAATAGRMPAGLGGGLTPIDAFTHTLSEFTRYSHLRVVAELPQSDVFHSSNIVSSIEFDKDNEFFATAGVSRRIKVFDFRAAIVACGDAPLLPVLELSTRSKLSCLSWSKSVKSQVASSDYEGVVSLWDTASGACVVEFEEHEKRVWSVDFCRTDPTMLVSGSDDGKAKVWSTRDRNSVLDVDIRANVCCVKYNPTSSHHIAVGSADHNVHLYDLRQPRAPLHVFSGHQKAVSYVAFLSSGELVSASTDSTLRVWDVAAHRSVRTLRGHLNEKNFVGLSVCDDYIACGSETNEVVVYYKAVSQPTARHAFTLPAAGDESDAEAHQFISAVCWKGDGQLLLAANSDGVLRVLAQA